MNASSKACGVSPEIAKDLKIRHGDGWRARAFYDTGPPRCSRFSISKHGPRQHNFDVAGRGRLGPRANALTVRLRS